MTIAGGLGEAHVQPMALCVFRRSGDLLVTEYTDEATGERYYRPLGGGIASGERGQETVRREVREELGANVLNLNYLGSVENILTDMGTSGHEIVMVYEGTLGDKSMYLASAIEATENDGTIFRAVWKSLAEFAAGESVLYPEGLLDLLWRHDATSAGVSPQHCD